MPLLPRCSQRLSIESTPQVRSPRPFSNHCCSKPLRRENKTNFLQRSSGAPPAGHLCSFPPRRWSPCSLLAAPQSPPPSTSRPSRKSDRSALAQRLARFHPRFSVLAQPLSSTCADGLEFRPEPQGS